MWLSWVLAVSVVVVNEGHSESSLQNIHAAWISNQLQPTIPCVTPKWMSMFIEDWAWTKWNKSDICKVLQSYILIFNLNKSSFQILLWLLQHLPSIIHPPHDFLSPETLRFWRRDAFWPLLKWTCVTFISKMGCISLTRKDARIAGYKT